MKHDWQYLHTHKEGNFFYITERADISNGHLVRVKRSEVGSDKEITLFVQFFQLQSEGAVFSTPTTPVLMEKKQ